LTLNETSAATVMIGTPVEFGGAAPASCADWPGHTGRIN
jgi:heme A synthase